MEEEGQGGEGEEEGQREGGEGEGEAMFWPHGWGAQLPRHPPWGATCAARKNVLRVTCTALFLCHLRTITSR